MSKNTNTQILSKPKGRSVRKRNLPADGGSLVIVEIEAPQEEQRDAASEVSSLETTPSAARDTLGTVHRLASRLHEAGVFSKTTLREYDELCLTEVKPMGAHEIKGLREKVGVSQAVLARVLNVTTNAVGQWERGEKKPTGSALKLLALVREKGLNSVL